MALYRSEIEGELLNRDSVQSSLRREFGPAQTRESENEDLAPLMLTFRGRAQEQLAFRASSVNKKLVRIENEFRHVNNLYDSIN